MELEFSRHVFEKCMISLTKAVFNRNRALFTGILDLDLRNKLVKCYIWSVALYGTGTWDTLGSRSETRGKF